jgi:amino acid adenylation domain-containing protein
MKNHQRKIPSTLLQEMFTAQALVRKEQPALITPGKILSYNQLYQSANGLGYLLKDLGAKPNQLVAVVMEKGWEQVIAVLGILNAGAAYLPLSPELPQERLHYLLTHSDVQIVLTQERIKDRIKIPGGKISLTVDSADLLKGIDKTLLAPQQEPDDLVNVIYTSGSTGLPKGVMISQRGLINCIIETNRHFKINPNDRVLALTALHHDMSAFDIFGILSAGGTIIIPDAAHMKDPAHWLELIVNQKVTVWNSVPAMMEMFLEYINSYSSLTLESLRLAFLGGDWIHLSIPHRLKKYAPGVRVVSVGGPTETTLWNIWYPVKEVDPHWKSIPYGKPIANTKYYILDNQLQPCPEGVTGELCCAGVGVAKGYWKDPQRTAEKFIIHPEIKERLYRTGDMGRLLADGNIEFMGREDTQVKLHGQRIELGEIENTLRQHKDIHEAVVVAKASHSQGKQLAAYYISPKNTALDTRELQKFLQTKLPAHMVPLFFRQMERFPLTPNGKIDRKLLAADEGLPGDNNECLRITGIIKQHPQVKDTITVVQNDAGPGNTIVSYIVPHQTDNHPGNHQETRQKTADLVSQWQKIYDETYDKSAEYQDKTFNITGWTSSYTGKAIPAEEMWEWVDSTVQQVLALHPGQALEIGCGTGLLLFRLAPLCSLYHGTDFSEVVVDTLKSELAKNSKKYGHVEVFQKTADDFKGMAGKTFDTVILNSVTQLFPSIEYLVKVLEGAVRVTEPGGAIFVGDVRSLPLLEAFHTSVQLYQTPASASVEDLKSRIEKRINREKELVIHPEFFFQLRQYLPRISRVEVLLKPGRCMNELTKFRYDVILRIDAGVSIEQQSPWLDWRGHFAAVDAVARYLNAKKPTILNIKDIPNARLIEEINYLQLLEKIEPIKPVSHLTAAVENQSTTNGCQPEDFRTVLQQMGYNVQITWAGSGKLDHFDVIIRKAVEPAQEQMSTATAPGQNVPLAEQRDWARYANNPLGVVSSSQLQDSLHHLLKVKLPANLNPPLLMIIPGFPLTSDGNVDYNALPVPGSDRTFLNVPFESPRTLTEKKIAAIWNKLLTAKQIGIHDDFFALGGHSLNAIQLITRLESEFGIKIPLKDLYVFPTISKLSEKIHAAKIKHRPLTTLPQLIPEPDKKYLPFPLNDQQRAYWVGKAGGFEIGNVDCHVYFEVDCTHLDPDRLNQACSSIINRHDALRTVILPDGQQKILEKDPPYHIRMLDLTGKSPFEKEKELHVIREKLSHQVFKGNKWPLFELIVSKIDHRHYRVHVSYDGIIIDGISHFILVEDFYRKYLYPGKELPGITITFRDYVLTALKLPETELYRESREYWLKQLAVDMPAAPALPRRISSQSLHQPRFKRWSLKIRQDIYEGFTKKARRAGVTVSVALLTAFSEILAAWCNHTKFTINIPNFNRFNFHPQVNDIVGEFASFTLLTLNYDRPVTFENRALQVQQQLWKDLEHSYFSGVEILRELNKMYQNTHYVLMPVVFSSLLNLKDNENRMSSKLNVVYHVTQTPQVWLDCIISEEDGTLLLDWDVVEELFPEGMVPAMFDAYCEFVHKLAADENTWLEMYHNFIPTGDQQLRDSLNAHWVDWPDILIQELFIKQAAVHNKQQAVISSTGTLTYSELFKKAKQLGQLLRHLGAGPNRLIAVVMEKGWEQVAGVMGILLAGAAYLPLQPDLPGERFADLLKDSEARIVLTQSWLKNQINWPTDVEIQCLCIDEEELLPDRDNHPLENLQQQDDLAYVIYTSGSTGTPKGVMIDHRALVNMVMYTNRSFHIGVEDKILAVTALYHDLSVYDIFGMLSAGGTIVMPEHSQVKEPAHWLELINQHRISTWNTVPMMAEMLVEYTKSIPNAAVGSLRLAILGGDWIPVSLPQRLKSIAENVQILCIGGPTETTVWNIWFPLQTVDPQWKSIPYGKPIANNKYYVLNKRLEDCPVWVTGTLYCAGVGLSKGYWKDEQKTDQKFITHPRKGERIYNTGDLGRYLPDGNIEIMGREDFQVNIHGMRIELGEIEKNLEKHHSVLSAIVFVHEESYSKKHLVAYYTAKNDVETGTHELKEFLKNKLPAHMVPLSFIKVENFPLSPTGKIDRQKLGQLHHPSMQTPAKDPLAAPRSPVELQLAEALKDILQLQHVGIYDDFITLGGNSLTAIKLIAKIDDMYRVRIPLAEIFVESTIDSMVVAVAQHLALQGELEKTSQWLEKIQDLPEEIVEMMLKNNQCTLTGENSETTPGDTDTADKITRLSPLKRALFILQMKNHLDKKEIGRGIPGRRSTDLHIIPLSPGQQGIWMFEEIDPHCLRFNIPFTVYIKGDLKFNTLEKAINEIIRRHEVLRTTIRINNDTPVQEIAKKLVFKPDNLDFSDKPREHKEKLVAEIIDRETKKPFDLSQMPLFRIALIKIENELTLMLLTMHHIICDEQSFGIFIDEMTQLYDAFLKNETAALPGLAIQYADYAIWKQEWLKSAEYNQQSAYWEEQLAGNLDYVKLPMKEFSPNIKSYEGKYYYLDISKEMVDSLKALCHKENVTLFMLFLSVFMTLLFRYSGQRDVAIATPMSGRKWTETGNLIGLFVNMIIIRMNLREEIKFNDLLADSRKIVSQAFSNQQIPFEELMKSQRLDSKLKHLPTHVIFNFIGSERKEKKLGEITIIPTEYVKVSVSHNLGLFVEETGDGLKAALSYKTKAFDDAIIQQMAEHFKSLLKEIILCPHQEILNIKLSGPSVENNEGAADEVAADSQDQFNF